MRIIHWKFQITDHSSTVCTFVINENIEIEIHSKTAFNSQLHELGFVIFGQLKVIRKI